MSEENSKKNSDHIIDSVFLWLIFGVLVVVVPPIYVIIYKMILGYDFSYIEYTPDVLLVVLSICCNLMNLFVDREKRIYRAARWIFSIILVLVSLGCWGLFFIVRFNLITFDDVILQILYKSSLTITIICAIIGCVIEGVSNYKKRKEGRRDEENNSKNEKK